MQASSRGIHVAVFDPANGYKKVWYNVYDTCCGDSPMKANQKLVADIDE
jgi:hypothetical protein